MKWIFSIMAAQLALTIFILLRLDELNHQNQLLSQLIEQKQDLNPHTERQKTYSDVNLGAQEDQLSYKTIQRELAFLAEKIDKLSYQVAQEEKPAIKQNLPSAEQKSQQDMLRNELNNLIYAGSVSQDQLESIQIKAASLHPGQRKQMFQEISRAINSGELEMAK